eukprot:TRINITY_DN14553_c0_g1_i1.p1 TRINITY_DN14553_c0_g1~~TRINITY_DN14553_c0_g1_i1.p1  ORF type:complete len:347 (+),score=95.67 TRINITY_DN14553_c0_g1_i1:334-1374(+)
MAHLMDYQTLPSSTDHSSDTENEYSSSGGEESLGSSDMEQYSPPTSPPAPSLPLHHKFHKNKYNTQKSDSSSRSRSRSSSPNSKEDRERECGWCGTKQTPMWRRGPLGKSTLCNACGVRYSLSPNQNKDKVSKLLKHSKSSHNKDKVSKHHSSPSHLDSDSDKNSPRINSTDSSHSSVISVVNHSTNTTTNINGSNTNKGYYYCRYCDQSWDMNYFKNSQQFGAHCSNCSRKRRVKDVGNITTSSNSSLSKDSNKDSNINPNPKSKSREEMKELVKEVEKERDREMEEVRKEVTEVMEKWKEEWNRVLIENEQSVQKFISELYTKYNMEYVGDKGGKGGCNNVNRM